MTELRKQMAICPRAAAVTAILRGNETLTDFFHHLLLRYVSFSPASSSHVYAT